MGRIEVRLLGTFELVSDGRPVVVSAARQRCLLGVLAMAGGEAVATDVLGAAIFGSARLDNPRRGVQTYVARLRQVLGESVVSDGTGYRLKVDAEAVDALRFLRLTDPAIRASSATAERETLGTALGLWRGRPFSTLDSDWLDDSYGKLLTDRYLGALERRIDLDIAGGGIADLIAELTGLVETYPFREPLWARLLVVLARSGRTAEALAGYERLRRRLADELGAKPSAELQQIHADLLAPDGVFSPTGRSQLPSDIGHFTGREGPLEELDRASPVAVVHGTGGVGKTALAVHWAHRVRERFPDGQLFVNLRGYGPGRPADPAAALDSLLRALGVAGERIPAGLAERSAMLRSLLAGRQVLLVLDNARDTAQIQPLLPGPTCRVVVTSRNQLRDLDTPHRISLEQLDPGESVTLLTTRFETAYDDPALAELAELCGHLPLALVIAAEPASRDPGASLADLVEQLRSRQTRLDTLAIDDDMTNLRAVFSWSYQALDPDTARCFRLLSLHPGPDVSGRSVAALIDLPAPPADRLLDRLLDSNLLRRTGPGRYEQHDLLRAYAAELCAETDAAADQEAARARLVDWYLHSAANARQAMRFPPPLIGVGEPSADTMPATFDDSAQALAWFDHEREALLALVRDAAVRGHDRAAYRITHTVHHYLAHRYFLDEVIALQNIAIAAAERVGDTAAIATSANHLGMTYGRRLQHDEAVAHLERALRLFEKAGHERGQSAALSNLGAALSFAGRSADAIDPHQRSIEISMALGDVADAAISLNNLALSYVDLGRFDEAVEAARRAIDIHRASGNTRSEALTLDTLGQALAGLGRHSDAVGEYRRALAIYRSIVERWQECSTLARLGTAQYAAGRPDEARASWQQALAIYDDLGATDSAELRRADLVDLLATVTPDQ